MATAEQIAAWQRVEEVATGYDKNDRTARKALHERIVAYALVDPQVMERFAEILRDKVAERRAERTGAAPASRENFIGPVFPNYGRSKGMPVAGASRQDLEFYRKGCERTLADPEKARWHDKERALLAAIEAELAK